MEFKTPRYLKEYECVCGEKWNDVWDCECNDHCPECNKEIEPQSSQVISVMYCPECGNHDNDGHNSEHDPCVCCGSETEWKIFNGSHEAYDLFAEKNFPKDRK
ncbi:MAG: hypothetical protein IE916_00485 [Epsilonproteobacteria bacterium]|nr:hypothetical protein [Campylobacterota bacterium]